MTIHSKKIQADKRWLKAFKKYEALCGLEPMHQHEIDSGEITMHEAFELNLKWLEGVLVGCQNITRP